MKVPERKAEYLDLINRHYDLGAAAGERDSIPGNVFRGATAAAVDEKVTVLSAAGGAFIRGYLDQAGSK